MKEETLHQLMTSLSDEAMHDLLPSLDGEIIEEVLHKHIANLCDRFATWFRNHKETCKQKMPLDSPRVDLWYCICCGDRASCGSAHGFVFPDLRDASSLVDVIDGWRQPFDKSPLSYAVAWRQPGDKVLHLVCSDPDALAYLAKEVTFAVLTVDGRRLVELPS